MPRLFSHILRGDAPRVGAAGGSRVGFAGDFPAWRIVDPLADAAEVTGLGPGRVRVKRIELPPAEASTAARVAGVRAEGLLPEGVEGETAAGGVDADHRVWIAAVAGAARAGAGGAVADAATGLGAVLASELGLGRDQRTRLEAGVLLIAAAGGRAALVRVDAEGPTEAVVVDTDDGLGAALAEGVERIDSGFASLVGVGDAAEDPRVEGGAPQGAWLPVAEAFAPLVDAEIDLAGDGWRAAGAAGAASFAGLPVLGEAAPTTAAAGPGAPGRAWWAAAAAASLAAAALLAWSDLAAAARLDAALEARPALAEAEAQLVADAALFRWLESGGPTPLAVLDELTSLLEGVVPASVRVSADGLELEGTVDDPATLDALVERLASAETFGNVKLQRTQRVSDQEFSYAIDAEPVAQFYEAFVAGSEEPGEAAGDGSEAVAGESS